MTASLPSLLAAEDEEDEKDDEEEACERGGEVALAFEFSLGMP